MRFRDRPTGELLIFMVAGTVCFSVLASGLLVGILAITQPGIDLTVWITRTSAIINTLIGVLAGFLAGRTDTKPQVQPQEPEDPQEHRSSGA